MQNKLPRMRLVLDYAGVHCSSLRFKICYRKLFASQNSCSYEFRACGTHSTANPPNAKTPSLMLTKQIKKDRHKIPILFNLPRMRFERMTYRLEGGCSIQLSYRGPYVLFDFSWAQQDRAVAVSDFAGGKVFCPLPPKKPLGFFFASLVLSPAGS